MFLKKTLKTDQTLIYFSICFHIVFPIYIKMLTGYYKKTKASKKGLPKVSRSVWRGKNKGLNILLNLIEIFLKKKTKNINTVCECFNNLPEDEKQRLVEYLRKLFKNGKNTDRLILLATQDFF